MISQQGRSKSTGIESLTQGLFEYNSIYTCYTRCETSIAFLPVPPHLLTPSSSPSSCAHRSPWLLSPSSSLPRPFPCLVARRVSVLVAVANRHHSVNDEVERGQVLTPHGGWQSALFPLLRYPLRKEVRKSAKGISERKEGHFPSIKSPIEQKRGIKRTKRVYPPIVGRLYSLSHAIITPSFFTSGSCHLLS